MTIETTRRSLLAGSGALALGFSIAGDSLAQEHAGPDLPGDLKIHPKISSWLRIEANGRVRLLVGKVDAMDDFVTDMRDCLHALAFVAEVTLALENALVHHAARHVIVWRQVAPEEAFVVAHVLICFQSRPKHKNFAVLGRIHCPRINIEVGINLHEVHRIAFLLQ